MYTIGGAFTFGLSLGNASSAGGVVVVD